MVALTRRQFLVNGALMSVAAVGGAYTASVHQSSYFEKLTVTSYDIPTSQWPQNAAPLKIAFISDFHVGCMSVSLDKLDGIVAQVNALDADIILLGGDYLLGTTAMPGMDYVPPTPIAEKLAALSAPLGVYAVLGNHDRAYDEYAMMDALKKNHIHVLENDIVPLSHKGTRFELIGLADYLTRSPDVPAVMARRNHDMPTLILAHDPYVYFAAKGSFLAMLSGHTHGGQVRLPFVGPVISPTRGMPMDMLYGRVGRDDAPLIVSSGIGTSTLPVKNTPVEAVLVTIRADAPQEAA